MPEPIDTAFKRFGALRSEVETYTNSINTEEDTGHCPSLAGLFIQRSTSSNRLWPVRPSST